MNGGARIILACVEDTCSSGPTQKAREVGQFDRINRQIVDAGTKEKVEEV